MGKQLVEKWNSIDKIYKITFFSAFCFGLLTHMYMITNKLPNHDYVYNIYGDQFYWPLSLGRWFLNSIACLSSEFALPWLNGVLAIFYMAMTMVIIVSVLEIRHVIPVLLCAGLLASYPAFTDTMAYLFTVDGYMFAMLLAVLSVWFWHKNKRGAICWSALCLALAVGIYQAYISFTIMLMLIRMIVDIVENRYSDKELLWKIIRAAISGIVGMLLYYVILRCMCSYYNIGFASYMGVDSVAMGSITESISTLLKNIIVFGEMYIGGDSQFTAYEGLNVIFTILFLSSYICVIVKTKLYTRKVQLLLLGILSFLFIPGAYILDFISDDVVYLFRMLYCLVLPYMLLIKLADEYLVGKFSEIVMIVMIAIIANFMIIDNIAYFNMGYCWEQTYATAIQMQSRIYDLDEYSGNENVFVVGKVRSPERLWIIGEIPYMIGTSDVNLMRDEDWVVTFLNIDMGMELKRASAEQKEQILSDELYEEMDCWPAANSVQIIEDVIVIKLSEE